MNAEELRDFVITTLDDMKGREISCLYVSQITTVTDYMIVVTGTSSRHVKSLADDVAKKVKDAGNTVIGMEGQKQGEWVLIDLGDVLVHVMMEEVRKLYDLESLWGMKPSESEE